MTTAVALLVGLGNPGPRYAPTRHNVGFWFTDLVARQCSGTFRRESKFLGDVARVDCGEPTWLLKPETYMNHSGRSVQAMAAYYRLKPEQILVVHDDLDLPPGGIRVKRGGGHGGHNGLRDIMACLGSREFLRLRVGIGHPGDSRQVVDYVLDRPGRQEESEILEALEEAFRNLPRVLAGDLNQAMNVLHARKPAS